MMKITPDLIRTVHTLHQQSRSGRAIAAEVGCSEATVRRALALPVPTAERPAPRTRDAILLAHPIEPPSPCPESAPAPIRRLYASLLQRGLLGELDALVVALDLDVPRCHLTLAVHDADAVLCRLEALTEPIDLEKCIVRLQ